VCLFSYIEALYQFILILLLLFCVSVLSLFTESRNCVDAAGASRLHRMHQMRTVATNVPVELVRQYLRLSFCF